MVWPFLPFKMDGKFGNIMNIREEPEKMHSHNSFY